MKLFLSKNIVDSILSPLKTPSTTLRKVSYTSKTPPKTF